MGRPERPLDPAAGPVARLAHELRELRKAAGSPSYRKMAEAAAFSATTLSQAAAGERLPSLAVVRGYVQACGGDPDAWEPRWKDADAEVAGEVRDDAEDVVPYRGLARFEPADQGLFFGRSRLTEDLLQLVCGHRFAAMFGASGSGKSSLLRAGLIPRLQKEITGRGRPAVLRVLTPGDRPAATYGHLLTPGPDEPESWVVVDQFEEVFTLCRDRAERARFIDLLLAARDPDSRLRVLIAVRADFYPRCGEHRALADTLCGAGLLVGPMTAEELREAVVKPAQEVGLLVERELTARIVEEVLDAPGGLPMLSHALLETWRRRKGRVLTLTAYQAAGGVRGAIAASAEEAYGQLTEEQADAARRLLLRMVEPGQGTPDTRRPLSRAESQEWACPHVPVVVERLARARLLTVDEEAVQLAHEALITSWPRLRGWIEESREQLRHHRRLTEAARVWLEHDRDSGALYRGTRLDRVTELFPDQEHDLSLTAPERDFLTAALAVREAERRTAARAARRARAAVGVLSAVLAVALITGLAAWTQGRDNERHRVDDAARRISSVAEGLTTTDPRTAQLLGVAAWRVSRLPEAREALLSALDQQELDAFSDRAPGDGPFRRLTDSGRTLLSVEGHTWRTWDVARHRRIAEGRLPEAGVTVGASPDGRLLALYGPGPGDGLRLWDTAAGRWTDERLPVSSVVNFGGSTYTVRGVDESRAAVYSSADGKLLFEAADTAAPSEDGRLIAVCPLGKGGAPQLRDLTARRTVHGPWERAGDICGQETLQLVVGGGGRWLAAVLPSGVRLWDVRSGKRLPDLTDSGVRYAAFDQAGKLLALADGEKITLWRLGYGSPVFRYSLDNQHLGDLAWDPTRPVLRYLEAGTVHTLDVATAVTPAWQDRPRDKVLISPDGRTLATARRSGDTYRFELRDTGDGRLLSVLPPTPLGVSHDPARPVRPQYTLPHLAFTPDGKELAYAVTAPGYEASPQRLTVWDVARRRVRTTLDLAEKTSAGAVITIALGPDARTLHLTRTTTVGELTNETWDLARHRRTAVLTGLSSSHLAVRPDGRLLAGDNRTVRLPGGRPTGRDLVQGDEIGALAFAPDGSRFAAGDQTGRVGLWDAAVRQREGILPNVFPALPGGESGWPDGGPDPISDDTSEDVSALAVSPDGRTLAVGGEAGSLQLWDIATQQPLGGLLSTPGDPIDTVAFGPDSGMVYAGSAHVPLQHYVIDPARAVASVCARAGAPELTRAQWRTYVRDVPYRKVCGD
ncbi:nSTAND1 domain-containing NTPase [Streptomyces griseorubiginosus]|uniref:nSTAND1 domain-containing NTPase n=1 Tax=Streptomyces griseorubiginosus TaxID=67304 RepID=UPI0036E52F29